MRRQSSLMLLALGLGAAFLTGCTSLREEVSQAQQAYEEARYDSAEVWLTDLEQHEGSMDSDLQARFYFLRGMTALRLGQRGEALHYLALARETAGPRAEALGPAWRVELTRVLQEVEPGQSPENGDADEDPLEHERPPSHSK